MNLKKADHNKFTNLPMFKDLIDFMLDENWRLYLIEVNTNPCFDCGCSLLQRIIPDLLDNCFRIVLDPLFPSPDLSQNRKF